MSLPPPSLDYCLGLFIGSTVGSLVIAAVACYWFAKMDQLIERYDRMVVRLLKEKRIEVEPTEED